jgi:hypothetical protein
MKKGQLKQEVIRILKITKHHIENSNQDYNPDDLKALFSEALAYYNLYLMKKQNRKLDAQRMELEIVPKYEEGLRARIREYLDEA